MHYLFFFLAGGFVLLIGVFITCTAAAIYYYGPGTTSINLEKTHAMFLYIGLEMGRDNECTKIESSRVLFQELEEIGSWEHLCHNLEVSTVTMNSLKYEHARSASVLGDSSESC